jgi:aspartyl-tRNA(Asn)/glutamyl-tRNA(Gln) amidotransferase subunit A
MSSTLVADPGSLADLQRKLAEGDADPVRVLEASLLRIDVAEPQVQALRVDARESARSEAELLRTEFAQGRTRGPLHGIPVAIKDVIDVEGLPTRSGSRTRENAAPAAIDATVVTRLRAAGAVIVGKAHTTEFAYFDGPPPTRNPHDLTRTPGGSSAGPAAAVAAGMVPISLGTQTAGSVSRPAAYCGIAGFKPSTLAWPSFGVVPFAPSFDTVGLFAWRVADAVLASRALLFPFQRVDEAVRRTAPASMAFVEDPVLDAASPAVRATLAAVRDKLARSGLRVQTLGSPVSFAEINAWHKVVSECELGHVHGALLVAPEAEVTPALREAVARGRSIEKVNYIAALRALDGARNVFWPLAAEHDAVIFPAAPDIAPVGFKTGDPRFIIPFTSLGGPIVSVPVGFDQGLPLGIMLTAAPGRDAALLEVADRLAPAIEVPR